MDRTLPRLDSMGMFQTHSITISEMPTITEPIDRTRRITTQGKNQFNHSERNLEFVMRMDNQSRMSCRKSHPWLPSDWVQPLLPRMAERKEPATARLLFNENRRKNIQWFRTGPVVVKPEEKRASHRNAKNKVSVAQESETAGDSTWN
jgi:hypothetical protein